MKSALRILSFLLAALSAEVAAVSLTEQEALAKLSDIWQLELKGDRTRELELARELASQSCPVWIKEWAGGAVTRLTSVGHPVEMEFTAVDGRTYGLSEMKGKVVLIDFWATWCAPCVEALPKLAQLYSKYHVAGFDILGVSWDSDAVAFKKFLKQNRISWPQYFDGMKPGKWGEAFGIGGVPYTILVDKNGCVRVFGAAIDAQDLERNIKTSLAK